MYEALPLVSVIMPSCNHDKHIALAMPRNSKLLHKQFHCVFLMR